MSRDVSQVMIVEDESRYRNMLVEMVSELGFEPRPFETGESALRAVCAHPESSIPIAILDLNLPGIDGLEVARQLRQASTATQVIILTGFGDLPAAQEAMHLDAVDFLTKPCTIGQLEQSLARAKQRHLQAPTGQARQLPNRPSLSEVARTLESQARTQARQTQPEDEPSADGTSQLSLEQLERRHILSVLKQCDGNRREAAKVLGISERKLYYRLSEYEQS